LFVVVNCTDILFLRFITFATAQEWARNHTGAVQSLYVTLITEQVGMAWRFMPER
jgi:hypothetical protein